MLFRSYVEPDISDPHDPYTEAPIYPEPGICSCDIPYNDRDYDSNRHTIYDIWKTSWICGTASSILCISASVYLIVYGFGNKLEKGLCPSFWRIALRRCNNELERTLDDTFWNYGMAWSEHRILGGISCCITNCNSYERPLLVYEAENRHPKLS